MDVLPYTKNQVIFLQELLRKLYEIHQLMDGLPAYIKNPEPIYLKLDKQINKFMDNNESFMVIFKWIKQYFSNHEEKNEVARLILDEILSMELYSDLHARLSNNEF